jgi:hypothetical protein
MRADAILADRHRDVQVAARAWRRAGAIDETALEAILAGFPDDRARLGPAMRTLAFVFSCLAMAALFLLFASANRFEESTLGPLALFFGVALLVLTEVQIGPLKRSQGGTETATGACGLLFLWGGVYWGLHDVLRLRFEESTMLLAVAFVLLTIASVRWGGALWAGAAAICFFLFMARWPYSRLSWFLVPLLIATPLYAKSASPDLAPSHRRACGAALLVSLLALYASVHLGSWDHGLFGWLPALDGPSEIASLRPLAILGTALVPLVLLALGIVTRRPLLLNIGWVLGIASLVTLRLYVHIAPVSVVLMGGGSAAIALALVLRRYLNSGPGKERGGFTAEPLFEDPERRAPLEMAAVVALGPPAAPGRPEEFRGGGGRSGGGGATDSKEPRGWATLGEGLPHDTERTAHLRKSLHGPLDMLRFVGRRKLDADPREALGNDGEKEPLHIHPLVEELPREALGEARIPGGKAREHDGDDRVVARTDVESGSRHQISEGTSVREQSLSQHRAPLEKIEGA